MMNDWKFFVSKHCRSRELNVPYGALKSNELDTHAAWSFQKWYNIHTAWWRSPFNFASEEISQRESCCFFGNSDGRMPFSIEDMFWRKLLNEVFVGHCWLLSGGKSSKTLSSISNSWSSWSVPKIQLSVCATHTLVWYMAILFCVALDLPTRTAQNKMLIMYPVNGTNSFAWSFEWDQFFRRVPIV